MTNRWFRYYDEALDDPKVQALSGDTFKAWVNLLCVASRNNGKIECENVAFALRLTKAQAAKVMIDLGQAGLMDAEDGFYTPHNWAKRQYKSDVSNERVKRHRKRECNVTSTVTVTPPDTEAETEQKRDIEGERATNAKIGQAAHELADECYRLLGIEILSIPPEWHGLAYQTEMMLARSYNPSNILATFARLGAQRPLKPMNYFIKAVESAQQNQIKPAETQDARRIPGRLGTAQGDPNKSAIAACREWQRRFDKGEMDSGADRASIVGLPQGRLRGPDEVYRPGSAGPKRIFG